MQLLPADVLTYDVDASGILTLQEWLEGWEKNQLSEPEMEKSVSKAIEAVISDPDKTYSGRTDGSLFGPSVMLQLEAALDSRPVAAETDRETEAAKELADGSEQDVGKARASESEPEPEPES